MDRPSPLYTPLWFWCMIFFLKIAFVFHITSTMLLKRSLLLLFTLWEFQCLTIPKNQIIYAVKNAKNRMTFQHSNYTVKHKETLVGKGRFIDNINTTGYVPRDFFFRFWAKQRFLFVLIIHFFFFYSWTSFLLGILLGSSTPGASILVGDGILNWIKITNLIFRYYGYKCTVQVNWT